MIVSGLDILEWFNEWIDRRRGHEDGLNAKYRKGQILVAYYGMVHVGHLYFDGWD